MAEEHKQAKLKTLLKKDGIRLWDIPYTVNSEPDAHALKELSQKYAPELKSAASEIEALLETIRCQTIQRGQGNATYKETNIATLEIVLPKDMRKKQKHSLSIKLDATAQDLMDKICVAYGLQYIKLIVGGRALSPEKRLDEQKVKHNAKVMVLKISEPESKKEIAQTEEMEKSREERMKRTHKGFEILIERDGSDDPETTPFLEIADQRGNPINIPSNERKALILAMGFHEKGRALMKKKDYEFALWNLLEADQQFKKCQSSVLHTVDNYAVLQLDIVWCYRALEALTCLDDAKARLESAEGYFLKCYGQQKERLREIKGNTGQEEVLFLRMYLLQSLLAYLSGNVAHARKNLKKVEELYSQLQHDPNKLTELLSRGYSAQEARLGLRACEGNVEKAIMHIIKRREEKDEQMRKEREKRRIRLEAINTLHELGYSRKDAAVSLHRAEGDIDRAYMILLKSFQAEVANNNMLTEHSPLDRENKILQLTYLGFEADAAADALRKSRGDLQRATELLLDNNSVPSTSDTSSPSSSSPMSEEPSMSSESAGASSSSDGPMDEDLVNEILEDIPKHEEDYLDLTLDEESELIAKMQSYLQPYHE